MNYSYFIVDAFSDVAFGGVPVAVFPEAEKIPPAYLSALAEEVVSTNCVFIHSDTAPNRFKFQFYNTYGSCLPGAHTLIAGLAALQYSNKLNNDNVPIPIKIDTTEDCYDTFIDKSATKFPYLLKQRVIQNIDYFVPEQNDIAHITGLSDSDIVNNKYSTLISSCGQPYLILPLKSYHAVREARFHTKPWSTSSLPASLVDKILLFAPSTGSSGEDFHLRLLEKDGAQEADPAVGEALPAFAAYLCAQEHVRNGTHSIAVRRGANEARQSLLHLEFDKTEEASLTLRIGGSAVVSAKGQFLENAF